MGGASLVCTSLHCLQLIWQSHEVMEDGIVREVTEPVNFLLSVAPLHTPVREMVDSDAEEDEPEFEESTTFHAQAHADHITDILTNFYGIDDMMKWITNQTADSASVNLKLANILCISHVNYKNHLLNNELKMW